MTQYTDPFGTMSGFGLPTDEVWPESNTTSIPKSYPSPSAAQIEALRLNPQYGPDFDQKFGAGMAAAHLAEPVKTEALEDPSVYRPAISWGLQDLVEANKEVPPTWGLMQGYLEKEDRRARSLKDSAALSSVEAFRRSPSALLSPPQWLDKEISSAEFSLAWWQSELERKRASHAPIGPEEQIYLARAEARVKAARDAKEDYLDRIDRQGAPEVQMVLAEKIADQKRRVAYAESQLELAQSDPTLSEQSGRETADYARALQIERKKLNALEEAFDYARQQKAVAGATWAGEVGRSLFRAIAADSPEILAGAIQRLAKTVGTEEASLVQDLAAEVKTLVKDLKRELPAPAQGELLALDPKSPTFARDLKLWSAHALGQGFGTSLPMMLAAAAAGAPGAGSAGLAMGVGQMENALEEEFAKEGLRLQDYDVGAIVYGFGTAIGILDSYALLFNLGELKHQIKSQAVRHMASAVARGMAKGAGMEGLTEAMQEALQIMGENYALERGLDWQKFAKRTIESFAAGAVPGAAFGARGGVVEQRAARGQKVLEDLRREIEEASKLETQVPGEGQPAGAAGAGDEKKEEGRPKVQAEARDPSTLPKIESVPPQVETQKELSSDEKADLKAVAERSGLATEETDPEDAIQRMRQERLDGASFGQFDEVLDRLTAVEAEQERQRAESAIVRPDEVGPLIEMWRYVEEQRAVPHPERLVEFLRRTGGIIDEGGDIRAMLGEARQRPGLVNQRGSTLDDATLRAWEQGFLEGQERPDINALLEAIDRDLRDDTQVRVADRVALDDRRIVAEMERELADLGIKKGMTENDVRQVLTRGHLGESAQDRTASDRRAGPRTLREGLDQIALQAYLDQGGSLNLANIDRIADALEIERAAVPAVLEQAVEAGLLRKDSRGRYRRVAQAEGPVAAIGPFPSKKTKDSTSAEKDEQRHLKAVADLIIQSVVHDGNSVTVPKTVREGLLKELRKLSGLVPADTDLAVLHTFDPIPEDSPWRKFGADTAITFETTDGRLIGAYYSVRDILGARAFFDRRLGRSGGIVSARLSLGFGAVKALRGEVTHEVLHAIWPSLSRSFKSRLFVHAEALQVLDIQTGTYMQIIGHVSGGNRAHVPLRDRYREIYADRANLQDLIAQEAVAHMLELREHNWWMAEELAPIADILAEWDQSRRPAVEKDGETPFDPALAALNGYRIGRSVAEPEKLWFWQKPPRQGTVLMFHGTNRDFTRFDMGKSRDFGVHFGTAEQAGARLDWTRRMEGGRLIPVEIELKNAIEMSDPGFWGPLEIANALKRQGAEISDEEYQKFAALSRAIDHADRQVREVGDSMKPMLARAVRNANAAVRDLLNELGVDGIWYRNAAEGTGWSLLVWNEGQVKSAIDQRVLMALGGTGGDNIQVSVVRERGRDVIVLKSPFGHVSGVIHPDKGFVQAGGARVAEEHRGKGHGVALYERLVHEALSRGYPLVSDGPVSRDAARVYEALKRRGYDVVRNKYAEVDESGHVGLGGRPDENAYTVMAAPQLLAALGGSRRDIDPLGFYSKALEAAKAWPQPKGTPEQLIEWLKKSGVKDAEIKATNLKSVFEGKSSVTRDNLVKHLEENRVGLKENVYGGHRAGLGDRMAEALPNSVLDAMAAIADRFEPVGAAMEAPFLLANRLAPARGVPAKWSSHSLDPSNPTYRETVLHLPGSNKSAYDARLNELKQKYGSAPGEALRHMSEAEFSDLQALAEKATNDFTTGHFPEPNIVGHYQHSMVRLPDASSAPTYHGGLRKIGKANENPPNVFLLDQLQSDWGQRLRDKGVRDEAKIAAIEARIADAKSRQQQFMPERGAENLRYAHLSALDNRRIGIDGEQFLAETRAEIEHAVRMYKVSPEFLRALSDEALALAELKTAKSSIHGHPLVNTTDQWVNTTLRHAIRSAILADADYIAIPHGDTVLSYNLGDKHGMREFYGTRTHEGIVPKNLRKILEKLDNAIKPDRVEKVETSQGLQGWKGDKPTPEWRRLIDDRQRHIEAGFDKSQTGFTIFRLTDKVKQAVMDEGQPLFALAGRTLPDGQSRIASSGPVADIKSLADLNAELNKALGLTTRTGRLNPGLKASAAVSGGKLRGQYNAQTDVTRLANPLDIETLAHEGGHALEARFGIPFRTLMELHRAEIEPLASPGPDPVSEGFAEFFRRYVTNPKLAESRAPKFFIVFEEFIDIHEPGLLAALQSVSDGYQAWIDAPSETVVASTIVSAKKDGLVAELTKHVRRNGFINAGIEFFHSAYTQLIDGLHPVRRAVDALIEIANENLAVPLGRGREIGVAAAQDAYKLLRLARNAYQAGHADIMNGVRGYRGARHDGPSLRSAMGAAFGGFEDKSWSQENIQAFGSYLASRRMVAEWDRFKNGELDYPPDKISQADHIQNIKDLEAEYPSFIDGADMIYQYLGNLLKKATDAGFVSQETYDELRQRRDYVPVNRDMSEPTDDTQETVFSGSVVRGANKARLLKRFGGSTRDIINPLESIARATYEWNFVIARNEAIKALDLLARSVGPGGGAIAERIPASRMTGTQVNAIEVVKRAGKQAGVSDADMLFLTTALEQHLGEDADTVLFKPGELSEKGEPIVYLWEEGKRVAIRLADGKFGKEMYEAITGLGQETFGVGVNSRMPAILEAIAKPSQWLRAGVTLDPAFITANYLRDNPAAWINSADHGTLFPNFSGSLKATGDALSAAFGNRIEDLELLQSFGGITGSIGKEAFDQTKINRDVAALAKRGIRIKELRPHQKQFWELTGVTETGTRLSVFRKARERARRDGLSEYEALVEAAYTANDLIDYGRFGSRMLVARRLVTFLNAQLQGLDKAGRVATGHSEPMRTVMDVVSPYVRQSDGQVLSVQERQKVPLAAQFWAKVVVPMGFVGFALTYLYKDDPEFEEIPEYFRNTHWLFRDPSGTWRRIPKPFELGAFSLIAERGFEAYYKSNPRALEQLAWGLGSLVMPAHVVPGVQTGYELWANKSKFTGAPIVPQELQGLPGELQFNTYTSEFSKWMAVNTGISAAKIDHAIAGLTGSLGRTGLDLSNQILPPTGRALEAAGLPRLNLPTAPRPEMRQVDMPVIRRFTTDPNRSSQSKKDFWALMSKDNGEFAISAAGYKEFYDRQQYAEASERLLRMKEPERVYALIENHGLPGDKRSHPLNRAKQVLATTNGVRRDLDTGKLKDDAGNAYSPSDRRVIQEMIEQIQMKEARNALIVIGHKGYEMKRILDVEPTYAELRAKVPSIADEIEFRLRKARVKEFDDVRDGYADLKAQVLDPAYVPDNPPRRKVGRRAP